MAEGASPSSPTDPVFPPPALWGVDCHFSAFNKLYIADILSMKPYPSHPGAFAYGNHPMYRVDVMGIVVRKDDRPKLFLYSVDDGTGVINCWILCHVTGALSVAVDDGTGVINCCCWKQRYNSREGPQERTASLSGLGLLLRSELTALRTERDTDILPYHLGDMLHVRGNLKVFRHMMEIVASYHCRIDNPNRQVTRMLELPFLYGQCYDKPFVPPCQIEQEVMRVSTGQGLPTHRLQSVKEELKGQIQEVLVTLKAAEFSLSDLLKEPAIAELTKKMDQESGGTQAVREALKEMEEVEGTVCLRHQASLPYENLDRSSPLEGQVMSILRTLCSRPKYRDKGCHHQQIQNEVQRSVQYSSLRSAALLHVLGRLETNSDVIRVTHHCYLPL